MTVMPRTGGTPKPEVAVVIPTRDRETRLAFALDALAAQTLGPERFEVIVVRDDDLPGPRTSPPETINCRSLTRPGYSGPAEKRNTGWRSTEAPLVAFIDDDCRPAPEWLQHLLEAWSAADRDPRAIIQGRTEPDPDEQDLLTGFARSQEVVGPSHWYQTCNLAYPRQLLESLGGFDQGFEGVGGEDTDLGLRAEATGARLSYVGDALVWHAVHSRNLLDAMREAARWDGMALVFARHPEQRRRIYARVFWKRSHALAILALGGALLISRRRWAGIAGVLPYVRSNVGGRTAIAPRNLIAIGIHIPARFAVDLVEVFATVRGAIRFRSPLI
jgi:GT2 family glycosyltransferase